MSRNKDYFRFTFILLALILETILYIPENEALATSTLVSGKENGGPNGLGVISKHSKKKATANNRKSTIKVHKSPVDKNTSTKTYQGQNTRIDYLAMLMLSTEYDISYYGWLYASNAILLSETCVLARSYDLTFTTDGSTRPTLNTGLFGTIFIPRDGCDIQHHIESAYFNDPYYNENLAIHDITLLKPKRPIKFGNSVCGGQPVSPAWVSCDPEGPSPGFRDCYVISYGQKGNTTLSPPEDIVPNQTPVKILTHQECEAVRLAKGEEISMNPKDQICISAPDGTNPKCQDDHNIVLVCKYWNKANGWGSPQGWGSAHQDSPSSGWGSHSHTSEGWSSPSSGWESPSHDSSSGWGSHSQDSSSGWGSQPHDSSSGWGSHSHDSSSGWGSPSHDSSSGWGSQSHDSLSGWGSQSGGWGSPSHELLGPELPSTGWGSGGPGRRMPPSGWDWSDHKKERSVVDKGSSGGWSSHDQYVVVGHEEYFYGDRCPDKSASLILKYGSVTYRQLFGQEGCNFICSSDLSPGYRCKGNPHPSLGPVYCVPEKIHSTSGWTP